MSAIIFSTFPWQALGLLITILIGGLIFSNQDMLEDQAEESYNEVRESNVVDNDDPAEEECPSSCS